MSYRKGIVDAGVELTRFAFGGSLLVGVIIRGGWEYGAFKEDCLAIGPPLGVTGSRGQVCNPVSLAAGERQDVDLSGIVAFAFGGESNFRSIGAEHGS